jgi:hypothetical protein
MAVIHIPKTAGTSLRGELMSAFPDAIFLDIGTEPLDRAESSELEAFDIIFGHMHLDAMIKKELDTYKVAFVRHPVTAAASYWSFGRNFEHDPTVNKLPTIAAICRYNFDDWIKTADPNAFNFVSNFQSKFILGDSFGSEQLSDSVMKLIEK